MYALMSVVQSLQARGVASGWHFLKQEAGFGISESLIAYSPADSYLRALSVGLLNTLKVSLLAILGASAIGLLVGLIRLSSHWALSRLAGLYVELFRNTPQLLQIVFWYAVFVNLPAPRLALQPVEGVFLSNRGISLPTWADDRLWLMLVAASVAALIWVQWHRRRQAGGRSMSRFGWLIPVLAGLGLLAAIVHWNSEPLLTLPSLQGLNFRGGHTISPEFCALFLGLSLYIAAFIAEIVRGGIQSIDKGQSEAGRALGLTENQILRRVLIPQALRVMLPPAATQFASLVKNSSLAVAIGYPDLVNISNTTMNQTGHVVEAIVIMTTVYLAINFTISLAINLYNRHLARSTG